MRDWNHFFGSLRKYLDYLRTCTVVPSVQGFVPGPQTISENELYGLLSWARLATEIARNDVESRRNMYEDRGWNVIDTVVGLLTCAIPLELKGTLYRFLEALAKDEAAAIMIWNCMISEQICVILSNGQIRGIQQDLDEQECVIKVYDCTEGFLCLIKELMHHKTRPGAQKVAPYLQFLTNSIICNFSTRSYADVKQMWSMVKLALDSLYAMLNTFYVTPFTVANKCTEVLLLTQLLNDSPLSMTLLQVIVEGAVAIDREFGIRSPPPEQSSDRISSFPSKLLQKNPSRDAATFSAIRLLHSALSHRTAIADAIRNVHSDILISTTEAILFAQIPLPLGADQCYLSVLLSYISETDHLIGHTYYVWRLIRELCTQRPSLQPRLVQAMIPRKKQILNSMARLTSPSREMEVTLTDILLPIDDVEMMTKPRIRGEICRLFSDILCDSLESDPNSSNIAFLLANFDLNDLCNTDLSIPSANGDNLNWFHNILKIAEFLTGDTALALNDTTGNISGIYEPALRIILRLCSFRAVSSHAVLRYMRLQHNLVIKLLKCKVFREQIVWPSTENLIPVDHQPSLAASFNDSTHFVANAELALGECVDLEGTSIIVRKSIQATILELVALELSSLIRLCHVDSPKRIIALLLSETNAPPIFSSPIRRYNRTSDLSTTFAPPLASTPRAMTNSSVDEYQHRTAAASKIQEEKALLWSLLEQSRVYVEELEIPVCVKFDAQRLDELLTLCIRRNTTNVDQFDVGYLHLLLNSELATISHPEIDMIRREAHAVLLYCVRRNARNLLESACIHLLGGWLSVINVLALKCPLPFIEPAIHQSILVDSLFLLREYCQRVQVSAELAASLSACMFRLTKAHCSLLHFALLGKESKEQENVLLREALYPLLHLLLECLVLPGYSKCVSFKRDIYNAILKVFETCNRIKPVKSNISDMSQNGIESNKDDDDEAAHLTSMTMGPEASMDASAFSGFRSSFIDTMRSRRAEGDHWAAIFESLSHEIVQTIASDICFAPLILKIVATTVLSDIIREDIIHSQRITTELLVTGQMRCLLETLGKLVHPKLLDKSTENDLDDNLRRKRLLLVKALLSLVIRLAASTELERYFPGILAATKEWFQAYQIDGLKALSDKPLPPLLPTKPIPNLSSKPVIMALEGSSTNN